MHPANIQDRDGGVLVLGTLFGRFPFLKKLFADGGYQGPVFDHARKKILPHLETEIVKRSDTAVGFEVIPRRWVVERTFAWLGRCRRLAKDFENRTRTARAFLLLASIRPHAEKAMFKHINSSDGFSGKRLLFQLVGYVFFSVGFAGMLLPVLPTTIFWIVAAACFAKSAPGMYRRILAWPAVGAAIEDYLERGLIGPRSKTVALIGKAIGAILIVTSPMPAYATGISLLCIALAGAYVATRPGKLVATAPPNRSAGACAARIPSRALSN